MASFKDNPWNNYPGPDVLGSEYEAFYKWFFKCRGQAVKQLPNEGEPYIGSDELAWAYHPIIKNMSPDRARQLAEATWQAMWDARQWSAQTDVYQEWRGRIKGAREYQRELAEAGEVLKQAGAYPSLGLSLTKFIFHLQKHGVKLAPSNPEEKRNIGELLAVLGDGLVESAKIPPSRAWDWYGCLLFQRDLEPNGNKPEAPAMLAFHLVLLNRLATMENGPRLGAGMSMPEEGRPCYEGVAVAISMALGQHPTYDEVKAGVRRGRDAGYEWVGWHPPKFILERYGKG